MLKKGIKVRPLLLMDVTNMGHILLLITGKRNVEGKDWSNCSSPDTDVPEEADDQDW